MRRFWLLVGLLATSCVGEPAFAECLAPAVQTETLRLDADCVAPWPGWLFTASAYRDVLQDFDRLDAMVDDLEAAVDETAADAVALGEVCTAELEQAAVAFDTMAVRLRDARARASPWRMVLVGGLAASAPYAGGRLLGFGERGAVSGAAAGLGVALLVAWVTD